MEGNKIVNIDFYKKKMKITVILMYQNNTQKHENCILIPNNKLQDLEIEKKCFYDL